MYDSACTLRRMIDASPADPIFANIIAMLIVLIVDRFHIIAHARTDKVRIELIYYHRICHSAHARAWVSVGIA